MLSRPRAVRLGCDRSASREPRPGAGDLRANIAAYRSNGITSTSPEIVAIHSSTARLVAVDVRWPYLDADGTPKGEEVSSYVV
jgi:hypothetical protein